MSKKLLFFFLFGLCSLSQSAEYQSSEEFLKLAFSGSPPKPKILWFKNEIKQTATKILKHKPGFMRTRYWQSGTKTVWIIDETGKTKPISIAIIIKDKKIVRLKVLAFRESRGWEVKHNFFTNQFKHNSLDANLNLSHAIDGISGATLSVNALTKAAQLALYLDSQIQQ